MLGFNAWCSMSQNYKSELWPFVKDGTPAVQFPTINDLHDDTVQMFKNIYDEGALNNLFRQWNANQRQYKMWSFYVDKPENHDLIRDDLNMLAGADPEDFSMIGAWASDDGHEVGAVAGEPFWPIPPQVVKFMPLLMTDPGDPDAEPPIPPTYQNPTEPTDVNLLFGQAPRDFGSFYV